ncbi:hypothetical protein DFH07DRAFT_794244 [Mycena maculata]|uniref:RING-type domain-containing protein n=1 Tax=Mycena maculata TaxID=230809 RepID=A0AAD7NYJ5_9AGAR|nr:hypothetical protein DFH07DRAFT_794244 [Mycena maculata]
MNRPDRSGSGAVAGRSTKKSVNAVPSTRTPQGFHTNEISSHRSKSRSPSRNGSGSRSDPFMLSAVPVAPTTTNTTTVKRKRSSTSVGTATTPAVAEDVDRGQRIKSRPPTSSSTQTRAPPVASGSSFSHRPKRERERSRASADYAQRSAGDGDFPPAVRRGVDKGKTRQVMEVGTSLPPAPSYSGPLAAAEFERMRKELEIAREALKKTVHDSKKQLKKHNKTIEELRAQLAAETLARETARQEQEKALAVVSAKSRKNEELIQSIEVSLQCQICIELVSQPYAVVPCGHILCLSCLQQWFRSAPANDSDDGMDAEAREEFILTRAKSCPCCRAKVSRRPIPIFLVKSVATALRAAAASPAVAAEEDADPWKGLFLPDYESDEDEERYDTSDDDGTQFFEHYSEDELDDLDGAEVELAMGLGPLGPFPQELARFYQSASGSEEGSASESEDVEVEVGEDDSDDSDVGAVYDLARWEPPAHAVEFENMSNTMWKMQRRGCTPRLIVMFNVRYNHDEGLVAHVASMDATEHDVAAGRNRLFLGWNIDIDVSETEGDAEKIYIARQLRDIRRHPERWMVTERHGFPGRGIMDARRLVPVEEDAEIWDTSDSEAYSNGEYFM